MSSPGSEPVMRAAVAALVERFLEAWNAGDASRMAACWAADGDVVSTDGALARGADIGPLLEREHAGPLRGTRASMNLVAFRRIGERAALADAKMLIASFAPSAGGPPRSLEMHVVMLAEARNEGWRFVAVRPYVPFVK